MGRKTARTRSHGTHGCITDTLDGLAWAGDIGTTWHPYAWMALEEWSEREVRNANPEHLAAEADTVGVRLLGGAEGVTKALHWRLLDLTGQEHQE